ncbi:MAG: hypothetical protein H0T66_03985 [Geodermatophilaceae bacterium]|nr:hypothetical protein [Geodermatophilaceae bacterium]MDQ3454057.1 hypothetical protein [Actinomycetota bacterium]
MAAGLDKVWRVSAVIGGLFLLVMALGTESAVSWLFTTLIAVAGVLMLLGVAIRGEARIAGNVAVAVGSLGLVTIYWLVVPVILGVGLALLAVIDALDAQRTPAG